MNFINLAQKANRSIGSSLLNLALLTGSVTTGNAASAYYAGRRGGYSSKNQSYLVDSGLGNLSKNLLSAKNRMHIAKEETPRISTELSLTKGVAIRELVIVDRNVKDYRLFSRLGKPGVEVIEIPKEADGLNFLLGKLSQYEGLSAVHLLSHGASGELLLGNERIDSKTLQKNLQAFHVLDNAIAPGGDLLLYGCELAKSNEGENFLEIIKGSTHIDVAASNDRTGNMAFGGDWDLEIQKGDIEATPLPESIAMKDFTGVLQTQTFSMESGIVNVGDYAGAANNAQFNENGGSNYTLIVDGVDDGTKAINNGGLFYTYLGGAATESGVKLYLAGGEAFDPTSLFIYSSIPTTLTFTSDVSGSTMQTFSGSNGFTIDLSALAATTTSITISSSTNFSGRIDEVVFANVTAAPTGTSFLGLGANNSGGAGFKTITNIPEIVTSNIMDISGTEIFPIDNVSDPLVFVLKADGDDAESFDVTDMQILGFGGGTNYNSSVITFKNTAGTTIATMSGTPGALSATAQSMDSYFGGDNFPIAGVAEIEFSMITQAHNRFTLTTIAFSNVVAPPSSNTITFDDQMYTNTQDLDNFSITNAGTVFSFSSTSTAPGYEYRTTLNFCYAPTSGFINTTGASITELKFSTQDGSEIDLSSFKYINDFACFGAGLHQTLKVEGFKNGMSTGSTTFLANTNIVTADISSNTDFDDVDEIRITENGGGNINAPGFDDIVWAPAAPPSNAAPTIGGAVAGQNVNDNVTITPFSGITIADADGDNVTATITLDNNMKGVITGASSGTGPYTITSRTTASMQTTLRGLVFNPTDNRTTLSETTTFTVVVNDGTVDASNSSTTVVSNAVGPTLSSSTPSDGVSNVSSSANLTLVFNEAISLSTGNIQIIDLDDGSGTITISASSPVGQASVSGNTLTLNPTADLEKGTNYAVQITSAAIVDTGGKNFAGISDNTSLNFTTVAPSSVLVAATAFLEGAWNGSTAMTTMLEDANLVAASAPYNGINTHAGSENVASEAAVPDGAVDWVLVELREAGSAATANAGSKVGSAAGFLMSDGRIKATNGTSDLTIALSGNTGAAFYLVIYHRNHLPIMSASAISESGGVYSIDFTSNAANTYQSASALSSLSGGKFGMIAGDQNGDRQVNTTDLTNWRSQNGGPFSYASSTADFNLDGVINAVDRNDFQQPNSGKQSQVPN